MGVFVIAEAATTWRYGDELATAERSIKAAKACGADAWKTQWCSSGKTLAGRRNMPQNASIYEKQLQYPPERLEALKSLCDDSGIEFMCTVYLEKDVEIIAPLVKRFKVSAFESGDRGLASRMWSFNECVFVSYNRGDPRISFGQDTNYLYCVSKYPTPLDLLRLSEMREYDGLSDHTTSVLTGAVAVGCGARIIEKHVRLQFATPDTDPDYGHSLCLDAYRFEHPKEAVPIDGNSQFAQYVRNVREAESML